MFVQEVEAVFVAISWPHFDGAKMVAAPLGFLASRILCEGGLGDLWEDVERAGCRE